MQWLLQIGLMLGIPYVIKKVSNWKKAKMVTKQDYRMQDFEQKQKTSYFIVALLLLSIANYSYLIMNPKESIFTKLNLPFNAKTYQLRNTLREYLGDLKPSSEEFDLNSIESVQYEDARNEYDQLKVWYDLMKNKSNRNIYNAYGDAVYCSFCKEDMDYAFYYAPEVFQCYLGLFLLIGISTCSFQKALWRAPAAVFAFVMLMSELSLILSSNEILEALQTSYSWEKAEKTRHVLFFLVAVAILVKNRPNITKNDREKLFCEEIENLSTKAFNLSKIIQLKQQVEKGSTIGPSHPSKKMLLNRLMIDKEI